MRGLGSTVTKQQEADALEWPLSSSSGGSEGQRSDGSVEESSTASSSRAAGAIQDPGGDLAEEKSTSQRPSGEAPLALQSGAVLGSGGPLSGGMSAEGAPAGGVGRAGCPLPGKEGREEMKTTASGVSGLSASGCPTQLSPRGVGRGGGQAPGPVRGSRIPGPEGGVRARTEPAQQR